MFLILHGNGFTRYGESLWFFGGENGSEVDGMRGDLWAFNIPTQQWSWEAGDKGYNGTAHYGKIGVPSAINIPAARYAGQGW
jgi:hypothetical protein